MRFWRKKQPDPEQEAFEGSLDPSPAQSRLEQQKAEVFRVLRASQAQKQRDEAAVRSRNKVLAATELRIKSAQARRKLRK